jgi:hypothetical protein
MNSYQFEAVFDDDALWEQGNLGHGIHSDPARDYCDINFARAAAKMLAGG